MSSRFTSIGACFVALATLLALSAAPVSAQSSSRGEGRTAQTSGAEGGHTYRRQDRNKDRRGGNENKDRRGGYERKAPAGFEGGRSYRRDDRSYRQRNHGYRHHKRHQENRYRRDGRKDGGRLDSSRSGTPPVVIRVNPWLAD